MSVNTLFLKSFLIRVTSYPMYLTHMVFQHYRGDSQLLQTIFTLLEIFFDIYISDHGMVIKCDIRFSTIFKPYVVGKKLILQTNQIFKLIIHFFIFVHSKLLTQLSNHLKTVRSWLIFNFL